MSVHYASPTEIDDWNSHIKQNPDHGNIFQTKEFAKIKEANFWLPIYIVVNDIYILILQRNLPILGNFWYVPKGPGISSISELKKILPKLKSFAKKNNVFSIKLEPELLKTPEILDQLAKMNLKKSRAVQAANTVIVDLDRPIDDIVASFTSKTRGNIRAAKKADVTTKIVPISDKNCELFYKMMSQTIGGRSHVRNYEYFKNFWQSHFKAKTGIFMFASDGDNVIAMDFIMILGEKAARKDAASTRDHSVRGASALLEMFAIEYLKKNGVKKYDLYGSPPSDQIKNPNHPYYGFGTFKAGFNSYITDYVGCYDLVIKPSIYSFWRKYGERIAHHIYRKKHNDLYY